eukprot:TRINITY_DN893_c0_g1_i1.p2 TRINITY_DN893_c0_g1~~TRINITY_DN893_c0_g1_i1.p2  ORF type:complete len:183 (+),score=94.57 TRINITY_DN893_c0_g1_i1:82-549(+)
MSKVDVTGDYGPMLMAAAKRGNVELMNRIITENANALNLDIQDGLGNTALHYSAAANHTDTIVILTKHKANPNLLNFAGDTPLHVALAKNHEGALSALLQGGADLTIKNKKGVMAKNLAKSKEVREIIAAQTKIKEEIVEFDDDDMICSDDEDDE